MKQSDMWRDVLKRLKSDEHWRPSADSAEGQALLEMAELGWIAVVERDGANELVITDRGLDRLVQWG